MRTLLCSETQHILVLMELNDDGSDCDSLDNLLPILLERRREVRRNDVEDQL